MSRSGMLLDSTTSGPIIKRGVTMELSDESVTASTVYLGNETRVLSAGRRCQMRDNESGEAVNYFDQTVPAKKSWSINHHIVITETDA